MTGDRDVVKAGDGDVAGNAHPLPRKGVNHPECGLVVCAHDGAGQVPTPGEQRGDHLGAARCAVVPLPGRSRLDLGAHRGGGRFEHPGSGPVVRAVGVPREVGEVPVSMVTGEVVDQGAHSGIVVATDIHRRPGWAARQRDDRDHLRQPGDAHRRQHPVVEDDAVRFAGDARDPRGRVRVVDADRAHQDVVAPALRRNLDTAVDAIDEQQALVLVLEGGLATTPEDDAHHLLETVGEGSGRRVWNKAELPDRAHHALARVRARRALAVEDPGHRGDRDAGQAGDVIDRQRPLGPLRLCHERCRLQCLGGRACPCKRLPVSAYRLGRDDSPPHLVTQGFEQWPSIAAPTTDLQEPARRRHRSPPPTPTSSSLPRPAKIER